MLGEGTSSYLRKPPRFLGGSDDFFFGWKRPEEDDAGERCDVTRSYKELQGVTRKKQTATDLLVLTRLFGT